MEQAMLDTLRGWREQRDPSLRASHLLPSLAKLELLEPARTTRKSWPIHGPKAVLGRYHHANGPVDITFHGLLDHELYKLGTPHARIWIEEGGRWRIERASSKARLVVDGVRLEDLRTNLPLEDGSILQMGIIKLRFELASQDDYLGWVSTLEDVLLTERAPALFLKRFGGVCGPRFAIKEGATRVVGRSFPGKDVLARPAHWLDAALPDWDLGGLYDHERRHIAFRHIALRPVNDHDWELQVLATRQHVTVNGLDVSDSKLLRTGDEIGLGSVLFHFHNPMDELPSQRHTIKLPKLAHYSASVAVRGFGATRDASSRR